MGVSKTDFMRGMQCRKMLWLDKHKPNEKIIPPEVQELLDKGNDFGDRMMGYFGDYYETTTYKKNGKLDYSAMIKKTTESIEEGIPVICEAAFSYYNNYCAVDILHLTEKGYDMVEVKNSDSLKEQFIKDAGFQYYILSRSGVKISKILILHHTGNQDDIVLDDITGLAKEYASGIVDKNIWKLGKIRFEKEEPCISMGSQCDEPYECWYKEYCSDCKNFVPEE